MRVGEPQNLRWSDIDFTNEVLHVRDESFSKKTGSRAPNDQRQKSRIIPKHGVLLDFLRENRKSSGFVLKGDRGSHLNYNHILKAFVKEVITTQDGEFPTPEGELGFKDGWFDTFRHFFVSECFAAGIPEGEIRLWVGRSNSKIPAHYRHVRDGIAKANIRRTNFGAA